MFLYQGKSFFLRCKDSDYFTITEIFLLFFCFLSIFNAFTDRFYKHIDRLFKIYFCILVRAHQAIYVFFDLF